MTYYVEKAIDSFGKDKLLSLIYTEGLTRVEMHKVLKLSTSDSGLNAEVYKRMYKYLGIKELPYPRLKKEDRKFQLALDKYMPEYWNSSYLIIELLNRLNNPIFNFAEDSVRYVIAFPRHPKSNKDSNQIKAHIIAWEIYNSQYVPENHWVVPKDGEYTNLLEDNLILVDATEYKSKSMVGISNPSFRHGESLRPKLGGWSKISKLIIERDGCCKICDSTEDLVLHHIINYHLFLNPIVAHNNINLMTLCRSCHTKLHHHNTSIKVLIEVTQYEKLLELLETLKSQVPDTLMETYKDVEKQLGLTDNQQPSSC